MFDLFSIAAVIAEIAGRIYGALGQVAFSVQAAPIGGAGVGGAAGAGGGTQISRSAGSLVGSVLESLGYHYQSYLLDNLTDPLTNEVGGLIYLVGIVVAIVMTATQGEYKYGSWILIGPPLFFSVIIPRVPIDNAQWKFGFRAREQAAVEREVTRITAVSQVALAEAGGGKANVSQLFARYTNLVSVVSANIVDTISRGREDQDRTFVARAELFGMMHASRIKSVPIRRLLHLALFGHCRTVLDAAREAQDPLYRVNNPARAELLQTPSAQEARAHFQASHSRAEVLYRTLLELRKVNFGPEEASYIVTQLEPEVVAGSLFAGGPGALALGLRIAAIMNQSWSCKQVWAWTLRALEQTAAEELQSLTRHGESIGIEGSALMNLMGQAHGIPSANPITYSQGQISSSTDARNIQRIISQFILRNEAREPSRSAWLARFTSRLQVRNIEGHFQGRNSFTEQSRLGAMEWAEKERLIHAAASLPYYQGLTLYFLGVTFPFFALLLLIPGKQAGFFLWFALWLWIKSWDVALALVMFVDDLLFGMLSVQNQTIGQRDGIFGDQELDLVYASLSEMDPTFQLATYYTIIATAVLAVPPTTAQLVLGSLRGGATLIAAGVEKAADHFATDTRFGTQQIATNNLQLQMLENKALRQARYQSNVQNGQSPYAGGPQNEQFRTQNPAQMNPVQAAMRSAGGAFAGLAGQPGNGITSQQAGQFLGQLAGDSGFYEGLVNPPGVLTKGPAGQFANTIASMYSARTRNVDGAHWRAALDLMEHDRRAISMHAEWDADIDQRSIYLNEMIALYEGIPIPHSSFSTESSSGEFNLALARYTFNQRMRQAEWEAAADIFQGFRHLATGVVGRLTGAAPNQTLSMADIQQLTPEVRLEIRRRWGLYLANQSRLGQILMNPATRTAGTGLGVLGTMGNWKTWSRMWDTLGVRVHPGVPGRETVGLVPSPSIDAHESVRTGVNQSGGGSPTTNPPSGGTPRISGPGGPSGLGGPGEPGR